jgi:hypothetical protein
VGETVWKTELADRVGIAADLIEDRIGNLEVGLFQLLSHTLSPKLVPATDVIRAVAKLQVIVDKHGYKIPSKDLSFIYQLETSFLLNKNGILTIYLHLPLIKNGDVLSIYEYVNIPMALEGSKNAIRIVPESELLAVTKHRDMFILLNAVQLEGCTKLGSKYICSGIDYLLKNFNDYCVTALFLSESEHAKRLCSTTVVPAQIVVEQLSRLQYLVYHPNEQMITKVCPNKPEERITFRGAETINLNDGCFAHSTAYKLTPHMQFGISSHATKVNTSLYIKDLLGNLTTRTLDVLVPSPPKEAIKIPDLVRQYWEIQARTVGTPWHLSDIFGISVSTSTLLILLTCAIVFVCRHSIGHMFHRAVRRTIGANPIPHENADGPPSHPLPVPQGYRNAASLRTHRMEELEVEQASLRRQIRMDPPSYSLEEEQKMNLELEKLLTISKRDEAGKGRETDIKVKTITI